MILQLLFVLTAIIIGARLGGIEDCKILQQHPERGRIRLEKHREHVILDQFHFFEHGY